MMKHVEREEARKTPSSQNQPQNQSQREPQEANA
jgi:hypothetical protein